MQQTNTFKHLERIAFCMLVILALSIIVIPTYYLTCDGPSHTYNAKIFFDYLLNHNRDFYKNYFTVNKSLDPNWLSQIILGVLIQFVEARIAEKIFQCMLVISFAFGFRYLIQSIQKQNAFLSLLFYPFCFTIPFQTGFYNYCLGLALSLFFVGYFLRHRTWLQPSHLLSLAVLGLACTLSHGMAASNAIILVSVVFIVENFEGLLQFQNKETRSKVWNEIALIALALLPSIVLILFFTLKRGVGITPHVFTKYQKWIQFLKMYCSQSTRTQEVFPAVIVGVLIYVLTALYIFTQRKYLNKLFIAFFIFASFLFFSYITCPQAIGGSGSIDIRLAFLPPMFLCVACAVHTWQNWMKYLVMSLAIVLQIWFLVIRFPHVMQASAEQTEIVKAQKFLKNNATILTLHYADYGAKNSFQIDNSFLHSTDYLGTNKNQQQLIILNYEADLSYFAMNWLPNKNPRNTINNLYQGVYPPCGNILDYEKQVDKTVDYISILGKPKSSTENCILSIDTFLKTNYICVYNDSLISNSSLWQRKNVAN